MRKFRRIMAVGVTVGVILTTSTIFGADTADAEKIKGLMEYSIMVGDGRGDMRLNENLTRAESAVIICRILGVYNTSMSEIFSDVNRNHWAFDYINAAFQNGIINGCGDNCFAPDREISYGEMAKMLITALGRQDIAKRTGDYPNGYMGQAKQLGLIEENVNPTHNMTRRDVAIMISNALDIPIMRMKELGEYEIMDGKNGTEYVTLKTMIESR